METQSKEKNLKILGISGSLFQEFEQTDGDRHDAAAVLVVDGEVRAAIEEERLNRIKHTDKFPSRSIAWVLAQEGIGLEDLDQICYYGLPGYHFEGQQSISISERIQHLLLQEFGLKVEEKKIYSVHHHLAHAVSAYYLSGFKQGLVLTIDGTGDGISGMVLKGEDKKLTKLDILSNDNSLGIYYLKVIHVLGYKQFDEYKVMGLAPYGNPSTYRELFKSFYTLLPKGQYKIDINKVKKVYLLFPERKQDEPFNQDHKDIAAALQESLEEIVLHVLQYYKEELGVENLCLAGGVAHNCSLNGRIQNSGLFREVFVQPVAHDAGCALGAALYRYFELNPGEQYPQFTHLYWGTPIGEDEEIEKKLEDWQGFVEYKKTENIYATTAQLISNGSVVGWVQGKSEFGPRALGNRSIVADPRPAQNKDIINEMVKKREAFRPFAPSVQEEYVREYYEIPQGNSAYPYMIFVVNVKEDKQQRLGAVTHIDGTARIQTVNRKTNEKYWQLIEEFRKITGEPILLNTSFNNNCEPIVDSVQDAVVCFLTTGLNHLVVGNYLVTKSAKDISQYNTLKPQLPTHNKVCQTRKYITSETIVKKYLIKNNFENGYHMELSPFAYDIVNEADGVRTLGELISRAFGPYPKKEETIILEILELWRRRFIKLQPKEK
jgi:carbamoyltransferase